MSTLKVNTVQHNTTGFSNVVQFTDGGGTENGRLAKAWVNFNGQGTVAIRDDFNVNSVSDDANGKYDINFSNAMSNSNYVATGTPGDTTAYSASVCGMDFNAPTTTKVSVSVEDLDGGATDRPYVRCVVFN